MSYTVTSTELKTNLGHYLNLLSEGAVIFITRNGKITGKMTSAVVSHVDSMSGILEGKLPADFDIDNLRTERLTQV